MMEIVLYHAKDDYIFIGQIVGYRVVLLTWNGLVFYNTNAIMSEKIEYIYCVGEL